MGQNFNRQGNNGETASVCPGYLGERFNNQFDLTKMVNNIERPDLSKLEYLAFSASIEESDLENIRMALQRYLEVVGPIKQFLSDNAAGAVARAEDLLAVISGRLAPDRLDDISSVLNDVIKQTADKVARLEEGLSLPEH